MAAKAGGGLLAWQQDGAIWDALNVASDPAREVLTVKATGWAATGLPQLITGGSDHEVSRAPATYARNKNGRP